MLIRLLIPFLFFGVSVFGASLRLAPIFTDNMVLQRERPIIIWGTADAEEKISVTFLGKNASTVAANDGTWRIQIPALAAKATPASLSVRSSQEEIRLVNILVGDLWLCSGQSNMFFPMAPAGRIPGGVPNYENEIASANHPLIRLNSDDDHPLNTSGWQLCTPESVRGFSAIAYYFGETLHRELRVPIGLILRARGGTAIQYWTPREDALSVSFTKKYSDIAAQHISEIRAYNKAHQIRTKWDRSDRSGPKPPSPTPLSPEIQAARSFGREGYLYDRFIASLTPLPMTGVIWYQGESNSDIPENAKAYAETLPALIRSWRKHFQSPLPFGIVQLTNYNPGKNWPITRESQRRAAVSISDAGLLVTIDIGDPDDLHPIDKKPIGLRLADWALNKVYGKASPLSPEIMSVNFTDKVVITYDQALVLTGNADSSFEISSDGETWFPATIEIQGNRLILSSETVRHPHAARYAYQPNPKTVLFNADRLPASPFLLSRK